MLTAREIPDTNIFEISVDGSITRTEFDAAMARLERMIAQHGSIRLIEIIHGLGGIARDLERFRHDERNGIPDMVDVGAHQYRIVRRRNVLPGDANHAGQRSEVGDIVTGQNERNARHAPRTLHIGNAKACMGVR